MWSAGLAEWFAINGRHHLPWRLTTDPWAVLVSEVMLQQTSVARVLPRWQPFLSRWPSATDCAAAHLDDVLRDWAGLGYPRRARALWMTAARVAQHGWPRDEARLRDLPGVGAYTARALLAFSDLGSDSARPPRDVNLARVAARAALGREPGEVTAGVLDAALREGRPPGMAMREYAYALFDVGALHCRARPGCTSCPLRANCAAFTRPSHPAPASPSRRTPYRGSLRQLRGAVLAHTLASPRWSRDEVAQAVAAIPGATPERISAALDGLVADGLVASAEQPRR